MRTAVLCAVAGLVACGPSGPPQAAPGPPTPPLPTAVPAPTFTVGWTEVPAPPNGEAAAAAGAQWIEIGRSDERRQLAAVFRPSGEGPFPVVVYLHGSGGLGEVMLAWAPQLAAAGFLTVAGCWVFTPSLSGVIACPSGPLSPGGGGGGVEALIAAARTLPGAREDAVGLLGLSAGADEALRAAKTSDGVKAVAADSGSPVWTSNDRPLRLAVLLLAGEREIGFNRRYADGLRQQGTPVEEAYYPGGRHVVTLDPELDATRQAIDFFRRRL